MRTRTPLNVSDASNNAITQRFIGGHFVDVCRPVGLSVRQLYQHDEYVHYHGFWLLSHCIRSLRTHALARSSAASPALHRVRAINKTALQ